MAGYSAVGSALPWGGRGRGFKSRYSDQRKNSTIWCCFFLLFCFAGFEGEAVLNGLPGDDQIRRLTEDRSPRTNPATQTK